MLKGDSYADSEVQQAVQEQVNERLENAMEDLKQKYANQARNTVDNSVDQPTGDAYKQAQALRLKEINKAGQNDKGLTFFDEEVHQRIPTEDENPAEDDGNGDEDHELRQLREQRLRQIKAQQIEKLENIGKGHGQYREIVQDEFLSEVTSSKRVICHFYHRDFPRCSVMDMHLAKLATRHIETKFVKINAEKTPFFVEKLVIRTIPTVVFFIDGVAKGKLMGFEGLSDQMPENKKDEWPTIMLARILAANDMINNEAIVDDDGIEAAMKAKMEDLRRQGYLSLQAELMNLDDDDLSDTET